MINFKEQRKLHGYTQKEVAEKVGVTQNAIGFIERGTVDYQNSTYDLIISLVNLYTYSNLQTQKELNLRLIRENLGLSAETVSFETRISVSLITYYERNDYKGSYKNIKALLDFYENYKI